MNTTEEERAVLGLVWESLYTQQDENRLRRGEMYFHYFNVWKGNKAYKVYVYEDNYEKQLKGEEE